MKKIILVIIVCLLFPRGIIASTINYSLRIKVDDAYFVPKEEEGSDIRPITHEGTTYLPMRALVTALGAKISSNQGVIYIESGERVPMQSEKTKCYSKIEKIDTVIKEDTLLYVNGEQVHCRTLFYKNRMYLPVRTLSQVLGERIEYNSGRHILLIGNAELTAEDYFMTEEDVKEKLKSLRSKYPHNKYWNTVGITVPEGTDTSEYVTNQPCTHYFDYYFGYISDTCNSYKGADDIVGLQCYGFASKISDEIFGKEAPISTFSSYEEARIGDNVRVNNHSMIIVEKTSSYITVAEANFGAPCRIVWDRKVYKSSLEGAVYTTRY